MATILYFRRVEDAEARVGPVDGTLGEIIIFPGVRIERHETPETPRHSPTVQRRRATRAGRKSRA